MGARRDLSAGELVDPLGEFSGDVGGDFEPIVGTAERATGAASVERQHLRGGAVLTHEREGALLFEGTNILADDGDLNGVLGDISGDNCYAAETRAFVNEGNLWAMLFGRQGKLNADAIEEQENTKAWAFSGNTRFADLVVRTTGAYVQQCSGT